MRRILIAIAIFTIVGLASDGGLRVVAAADTEVSAAAEGIFPSGASLSGISLQGSTFAIGIVVQSDGSAVGQFQTVLLGSTLLGSSQSIALEGSVQGGSTGVGGSVSFWGTATLDMGDGTPPTDIPFSAIATTGGLQLTIGATELPTQTLGAGSIFIR
jgi:hypothetical protein